jgi:valyl-tRNA synthetase
MEIRLSVLRKDQFILVHWFLDLKNANENLSFNEKKREQEQEKLKTRLISFMPFMSNSFMIVRFDVSNKKLYLNEYETFKYKYPDESAYMGSKENLNQYVRDYFSDVNIQIMLRVIIASDRTRIEDKSQLSKYLVKIDKHNDIKKETKLSSEKRKENHDYYRYNLTTMENKLLVEQLKSSIAQLKVITTDESLQKIQELENILKNVKHISVTNKKINATEKARKINKENSRKKIEKACKKLLDESGKITVYSVAKMAKVSYPTAKKYKDIYEKYIMKNY